MNFIKARCFHAHKRGNYCITRGVKLRMRIKLIREALVFPFAIHLHSKAPWCTQNLKGNYRQKWSKRSWILVWKRTTFFLHELFHSISPENSFWWSSRVIFSGVFQGDYFLNPSLFAFLKFHNLHLNWYKIFKRKLALRSTSNFKCMNTTLDAI